MYVNSCLTFFAVFIFLLLSLSLSLYRFLFIFFCIHLSLFLSLIHYFFILTFNLSFSRFLFHGTFFFSFAVLHICPTCFLVAFLLSMYILFYHVCFLHCPVRLLFSAAFCYWRHQKSTVTMLSARVARILWPLTDEEFATNFPSLTYLETFSFIVSLSIFWNINGMLRTPYKHD